MHAQLVTVFGGTGFLGRRLVRHLHDASFAVRIASRHPDRAVMSFPDAGPQLRSVHGDINEDKSVTAAIGGAFAAATKPPTVHPLVRTHPETGTKAVWFHKGKTETVTGMSPKKPRIFCRI